MICLGKQPQLDSDFPVQYVLVPVWLSSSAWLKVKSWFLLLGAELIQVLLHCLESQVSQPWYPPGKAASLWASNRNICDPGAFETHPCRGLTKLIRPGFKVLKRKSYLSNCLGIWAEKSPKALSPPFFSLPPKGKFREELVCGEENKCFCKICTCEERVKRE